MLENKEKRVNNYGLAFMTGFSRQYKQVEKILQKHLPILLKDQTLGKILSKKKNTIYNIKKGYSYKFLFLLISLVLIPFFNSM